MNKIEELENKINQARKSYYNGSSEISDDLFDAWVDELAELDPKNKAVIGIGAEPISDWEKVEHKVRMGSLNKSQTDEDFISWKNKYIPHDQEMLATLKLDGLSVSLIYENGKLSKALSRGAGTFGENIVSNVSQMKYVPLKLSKKINATIRGEILLSKENHLNLFAEYSNPRNAASGVSRRLEGTDADKLDVLVYEIISDDLEYETKSSQFEILQSLGFKTPAFKMLKTSDEVIKMKADYHAKEREAYPYDLDGLVIWHNSIHEIEAAGFRDDRPYCARALKFASVSKEGYVADIILQVGNSGRITPIAKMDPPINLMGADVERASLHNFANINKLGIDIGAKALVCRSGDVIPLITQVSESTGTIFSTPTHCPKCNSELKFQGEFLMCLNSNDCPAQITGRISNWVKELNLLEWGDALIQRLVDDKKVVNVADLYKLKLDDLAKLERMGEKSAKKALDILWKDPSIKLEIFIGALSIPLIGQSSIKLLMEAGFDNLEKLYKLSIADMEKIKGLGPERAKSIYEGLVKNKPMIDEILSLGISIRERSIGKLSGKSFAITGTLSNKRSVLEEMITSAGGVVKSSVGKGLGFLVINDLSSTSSKAVSAKKFGTSLISEDQLLEMLNA